MCFCVFKRRWTIESVIMNGQKVFVQTIGKNGKTIRVKNAPKFIKEERFCDECGKKISIYNKRTKCFSCG